MRQPVTGRRLSMFLFVGALTAVVYFGLMFLCIEVVGMSASLSVSVAYVAAVSLHFLANRRITFRATSGNVTVQAVRYGALLGANYLMTLVVVHVVVEWFGGSPYAGAAAAAVASTALVYAISHSWVFSTKKGESA